MTPLVDLGFLLLTFFILTTHLIDQRAMDLAVPLPGPAGKANNTLTILLDARGHRYGYQGELGPSTALQPLDGRTLNNTLTRYRELSAGSGLPSICIVKTSIGVRYKNVVHTVDAIKQAGIAQFGVQDSLFDAERMLLLVHTSP